MHAASVRVDGDRLRRQDREDASDSAHVGPHLEHSPGGITAAFEDWAQTSFAHSAQRPSRVSDCDYAITRELATFRPEPGGNYGSL